MRCDETTSNVSAQLAEFAATLAADDLPETVAQQCKQALLDLLGIAVAGERVGETSHALERYASQSGGGAAWIWATGRRAPPATAALVNAAHARVLDYDDIIDYPQIHVTVCFAPAAIAIAQAARVDRPGQRLLAALAVGSEIQSRLAAAIAAGLGPGLPVMLASQLFGYLSAAAACGKVLGFDATRMLHALGLAQMQAAGTEEMVVHAPVSAGKILYAGLCNQGGAQSALMSLAGLSALGDPVGGQAGLLNACFPEAFELGPLTAGLGSRYESLKRCFKPQPGTLVSHPFCEAALGLMRLHRLRPDDISWVRLRVGPWGQAMCEPHDVRRQPPSASAAMNSIPYAVALALLRGQVGVNDFGAQARTDETVLRMAARIEHELDPTLAAPGSVEPGIVMIGCSDGAAYSERVDVAHGQPARPMSFDDIAAKFVRNITCARPSMSPGAIDRVIATVRELEQLDDLDSFLQQLSATAS
ncbi:MAG: MmgE/PrpD family protein [Pigmentiphaga sp.]|uniref:MmgE/PrpD family protein n=1 Tax=Pigmentiphaga sp. TaxID=1977564 RepID=UPI0029A19242|nr:MmgE/PrpD family protein [Pigmentiphaga sp.]MDX3906228.1 MmgE/PrpD family protein [Pigmentiphaga sp.]